jgi:hypothetical protein
MGIKLKRSAVASKAPTITDLELGELAVNTYDGKLFTKKNVGGAESIVEIGPVASVAGKTGAVSLAISDVGGLQTAIDAKVNAANPTFSGAVDMVSGSVRQSAQAVSALDIDCSSGNYFTKTINGGSTFTFSNVPASGKAFGFILRLTVTSGAAAWPAAVIWPGGVAPTLATSKTHLLVFTTDDSGTTWRGASIVDYSS